MKDDTLDHIELLPLELLYHLGRALSVATANANAQEHPPFETASWALGFAYGFDVATRLSDERWRERQSMIGDE